MMILGRRTARLSSTVPPQHGTRPIQQNATIWHQIVLGSLNYYFCTKNFFIGNNYMHVYFLEMKTYFRTDFVCILFTGFHSYDFLWSWAKSNAREFEIRKKRKLDKKVLMKKMNKKKETNFWVNERWRWSWDEKDLVWIFYAYRASLNNSSFVLF